MINTMGPLLDSWMSLLDGVISVPVYKEDVPESETGNYVVVREEGETADNNKKTFNDNSIVIVDIVTRFRNNINRSVADGIYNEIVGLVFDSPTEHNLPDQNGIQILNVFRENTPASLQEDNGSEKWFRIILRFNHRIHQT